MRPAAILLFPLLLAFGGMRAESSLVLQATPDRELYLAGSRHTVYLELKVGAAGVPAGAAETSSVRNVVLVLDRSGSMAGAPIQALREAVAASLNLLDARDIVSVVLFDSEVETVLEARRRDRVENLEAILAQVEPTGGSALYDALSQGAAQLRRHTGPATSSHLILLTDGPPTKGPREAADFASLAEVFAREQIVLSTIGLGADFNEDLLANLARIGHGRFRFAATPADIAGALQAELASPGALLARDVILTAEFDADCSELESTGWAPVVIKDLTATWHFPYVFSGQDLTLLLGADVQTRRFSYRLARIRLTWTDVADGQVHTLEQKPTIILEQDSEAVRRSANPAVARTVVRAAISDGLQKSIEQIDEGDFRRALRELRRARSTALDINFYLDDAQVQTSIGLFDAYLAEVQARGVGPLDRKVLRSGLFSRFESPVPEDKADEAQKPASSSSFKK
jgi:Ca-activated chloride channel family protein